MVWTWQSNLFQASCWETMGMVIGLDLNDGWTRPGPFAKFYHFVKNVELYGCALSIHKWYTCWHTQIYLFFALFVFYLP